MGNRGIIFLISHLNHVTPYLNRLENMVHIPAKFHDFSVMLTNLKDSHDLTIVF